MLVLCYQKFFYNILSLTKSLPFMFNFSNITFIAHLFYKSHNVQLYQINYFRCYRGNRVSQFSCFFYLFCVLNVEVSRNQEIQLAGYIFSSAFSEKITEKYEIFSTSIRMKRNKFFQSHTITFHMRMLGNFSFPSVPVCGKFSISGKPP